MTDRTYRAEVHRLLSGRWQGYVWRSDNPGVVFDCYASGSWAECVGEIERAYPAAKIAPVCAECRASEEEEV